MTKPSLLVVTEAQKDAIRKNINVTETQLKEDVKIVEEWFKKQQHLPDTELDPRLIECILISRKGSVEQTKHKIDMLFTLRNVFPEMAAPRDILDPGVQSVMKGFNYVTLPKLNNDLTRVSIIQYKDAEYFNLNSTANLVCMMSEHRLVHDYFSGERYVFDMNGFTLGHMLKYSPVVCKNAENYIRNAFGMRIFGVHIVNGSNLYNKLISILKAGLSEKIGSRIYVHPNFESMHEVLDKDILPKEFGGNEKPVDQLVEDWVDELSRDENRKYLMDQEKLRTNEKLRIANPLDEELLGIAGTFRKLEVD